MLPFSINVKGGEIKTIWLGIFKGFPSMPKGEIGIIMVGWHVACIDVNLVVDRGLDELLVL